MDRGIGKLTRENRTGSRERISMNKLTEKGHIDPREVGALHPAMPQGMIADGPKYQRRFNW